MLGTPTADVTGRTALELAVSRERCGSTCSTPDANLLVDLGTPSTPMEDVT